MPKEFFSAANARSVDSVPQGGAIHVVGVSGVAMAQIAVELSKRGYRVSGSDVEFYEPMGTLLRSSSVRLMQGYSEGNVPNDAALVVIGNSISYGNLEVEAVEQRNLPYTFFPKLLSELVIRDAHSIVVSGTHGKTTTAGLCASVLKSAGEDPGYFVGGIVRGLGGSLHTGKGKFSVVEGDEYDSAFFAKVPKFTFFKPQTLIITAIEYDHADIYPNLDSIIVEFDKIARTVPKSGTIVCCSDCPNIQNLIPVLRNEAAARVVSYGSEAASDVRIVKRTPTSSGQDVTLQSKEFGELFFSLPLSGEHNARNGAAVLLACYLNGIPKEEIQKGLASFEGVLRRQDVRVRSGGITLIDDFAHHPTAVFETLRALRERYSPARMWAIFEPRSNTSRRKVFQKEYVKAFQLADIVILNEVTQRRVDEGQELLSVPDLAREIGSASGKPAYVFPNSDAIAKHVSEEMKGGDLIVVMTNGSFGGLIDKLSKCISEKR